GGLEPVRKEGLSIMAGAAQFASRPPQSLTEAITRTIRHDVGDLLQTIYATAAILQKRLPGEYEVEGRIITDLRARAAGCKDLLDTIHDFVCPVNLEVQSVDLAEVAEELVAAAVPAHKQLSIQARDQEHPRVAADPARIAQVGEI